jgi:penicillin-binding protein 2
MRFRVLETILFSLLLLLLSALFFVQVIQGSYFRQRSERNRIRPVPIKASRGIISDRWGVVLAASRPGINISVVPRDFLPTQRALLARLLGMPESDIASKLVNIPKYSSSPVLIKQDVAKEVAYQVEERQPELAGVLVQLEPLRYYPHHAISSHVVGYIGRLNKEEYEALRDQGWMQDAWIGRAGVEKMYDELLRGKDGGRQIEVNARGQQVQVLSELDPEPGHDLQLTVDQYLQEVGWNALGTRSGTICLIDLENWEVICLVSKPGYDSNFFVDPDKSAERLALIRNKQRPFLNRGVSSSFPPGSVFKLILATAGLELGKINPTTTFFCSGSLIPGKKIFQCWNKEGHGYLNLYQAIERSCNVYFFNVGRLVGASNIAKYARLYGLGQKVDLELPDVASGLVPDPEWKAKNFKDQSWYMGETYNFSIGQGYLLVTPLQMARVVGCIAKNGEIADFTILKNHQKIKKNVQLKPSTIQTLKQAMLKVVQSDRGTGQYARVDFFKVAAKTGTAQNPPGKSHAWFTGFFPYDKPEVAIVVFIEHGGSGGLNAAPIAKEMITAWYQQKLQRANLLQDTQTQPIAVPTTHKEIPA